MYLYVQVPLVAYPPNNYSLFTPPISAPVIRLPNEIVHG